MLTPDQAADILAALQSRISAEQAAHALYRLQAVVCEHDGYHAAAKHYAEEAAGEEQHYRRLVNRYLEMPGDALPDPNAPAPVEIRRSPAAMLDAGRAVESEAVEGYRALCSLALEAGDFATFRLASEILAEEEAHLADVTSDMEQLAAMGDPAWLLLQAGEKR